MLNVGSLVLGIGAWIFAILAIVTSKAAISHRRSVLSFCLCAFSLLLQLFELNRRVTIGDYAAIEDTIRAVLFASVILITITVSLNFAALLKAKKT